MSLNSIKAQTFLKGLLLCCYLFYHFLFGIYLIAHQGQAEKEIKIAQTKNKVYYHMKKGLLFSSNDTKLLSSVLFSEKSIFLAASKYVTHSLQETP